MDANNNYPYVGLMYWLMGDKSRILAKMPFVENHLPPEMKRIQGFKQHESHGGLDPVEHTFRVLYKTLDRTGIAPADEFLLNVATFYHDCGKADVADCDPDHPMRSGKIWVKEVAPNTPINPNIIIDIAVLVANHTSLASYVVGDITEEECLTFFQKDRRLFDLHHRMLTADIKAKPTFGRNGCASSFLDRVDDAYRSLREKTFDFR